MSCRRGLRRARAWTGRPAAASLSSPGGSSCAVICHCVFDCSSAAAALPATRPGGAGTLAPHADRPLLEVKADLKTGKIIATLPKPDADGVSGALHLPDAAGDRSRVGADRPRSRGAAGSRILVFRRIGKKVAAEIENPQVRRAERHRGRASATCATPSPTSTIWMGDVVDTKPDGSFTVDLASFLARDDFGIAARRQARRRRRLQVRARAQRGRPDFRQGLPEECRIRRAS